MVVSLCHNVKLVNSRQTSSSRNNNKNKIKGSSIAIGRTSFSFTYSPINLIPLCILFSNPFVEKEKVVHIEQKRSTFGSMLT